MVIKMRKFDKLIKEALRFNQTFKAPDLNDKIARRLEGVQKTKLPDGSWHVHGNLDLSNLKLTSLEGLNVSIVDYSFSCYNNHLTTLEGCPKEVKQSFCCSYNKLSSLKGCPESVGLDFLCSNNKLISLEMCPKIINNSFDCSYNNLSDLEEGPIYVKETYKCEYNDTKFTKMDVVRNCEVHGNIYT